MRELLLVRKWEEEQNAKKVANGEPVDTKSESISQHTGHAPSNADSNNAQTRELEVGPVTQDEQNPNNEPEAYECGPETALVEDEVVGQAAEAEAEVPSVDAENVATVEEPESEPEPEPAAPQISEEEKQRLEALKTKRQSLKEFFKTKPSYIKGQDQHNRTLSDTIIVEGASMSFGAAAQALEHKPDGTQTAPRDISDSIQEVSDEAVGHTKEALAPVEESSAEVDLAEEATATPTKESLAETAKKSPTQSADSEELSPDEKRQRLAASRSQQRKSLKDLMMQKKREAASRAADDEDIVVVSKKKSVQGAAETKDEAKEGQETPKRTSQSADDVEADSADVDSDGSIDLNKLIAQGSDLDDAALNGDIDGVDDNNEDFWKIDPSQLEKHLSPLSSPMRRLSPDPQVAQSSPAPSSFTLKVAAAAKEEDGNLSDTLLEVDGEEVDDLWSSPAGHDFERASTREEDEFDMHLDTQITPILQPTSSPSPSPSPRPSLSGGKIGLPEGLFSAHFSNVSPMSPGSSRASSIADPEEYETMSNGSYTSVRSAGSSKSGIAGPRRPSTTTGLRAPSRVGSNSVSPTRIGLATPSRPRSMSIVSTSSTEESTTSSIGGTHSPTRITSPTRGMRGMPTQTRPRSISRVSADDRPSASTLRSLGRSGTLGAKSGVTSPGKNQASKLTRSASVQQPLSGIARPASRAGTSTKMTPPSRSVSRLANVESKVSTGLKKPRPQSVAVKGASPATNRTGIKSPTSGLKSPGSGVRASGSSLNYSGRQSSDSLSSHEDYSASNVIFTPPDSPTETDSLTSLASSVSYGSSPGRETSPVPPAEPTIVSPTRRLTKPALARPASVAAISSPPSLNKPSTSKLGTASKLTTPSVRPTGLRRPKAS